MIFSLRPLRGSAVPAIVAEFGVEHGGKRTFGAGSEIGLDVARFAHAGNDGGDIFVVKDEAQGHFGHVHAISEKRFERIGVSHAALEILRDEISAAPVVLWPSATKREGPGERTFIERDARYDGNVLFTARRK
jgi:hypothetical protein